MATFSADTGPAPSTLLCIFCYKSVQRNKYDLSSPDAIAHSIESDLVPMDRLEACDKFYEQIQQHPGHWLLSKQAETEISSSGEKIASVWNPNKVGICRSCFYAINQHVKLFKKLESYQKKVHWQLDRFYNTMKQVDGIQRAENYTEHLMGDSGEEAVKEFRRKIYTICERKLSAIENQDTSLQFTASFTLSSLKGNKVDDGRGQAGTSSASTFRISPGQKEKLVTGTAMVKKRKSLAAPRSVKEAWSLKKSQVPLPCAKKRASGPKKPAEVWKLLAEQEMISCDVAIVKGSVEDQEKLDDCLRQAETENEPNSSDYDSDVQQNLPALMDIVNNLKYHRETLLGRGKRKKFKKVNATNEYEYEYLPVRRQRKTQLTKARPKVGKLNKGKFSIQCEKCGEQFVGKTMHTAKRLHFRHLDTTNLHDGELTWKFFCKLCGKLALNASCLKRHVFLKHRDDARRKQFSCKYCKVRFLQQTTLMHHFQSQHQEHVSVLATKEHKFKVEAEDGNMVAKREAFVEDPESPNMQNCNNDETCYN